MHLDMGACNVNSERINEKFSNVAMFQVICRCIPYKVEKIQFNLYREMTCNIVHLNMGSMQCILWKNKVKLNVGNYLILLNAVGNT